MEDEKRGESQHIVGESIRRHIIFVLVVAIAFTCAAAAFTLTRHTKYSSTASVLLVTLSGNPYSPDSQASGQQVTVAMTTEASLVTTPEVVAAVTKRMHAQGLPVPPKVVATVPPNTEIVEIHVTATSPHVAAVAAQDYAEAFLDYRSNQSKIATDHTVDSLTAQAKDANAQLKTASQEARSANPPPDAATQVTLLRSRLATLETSIGDLEAASTNPGHVNSPAVAPKKPDGLNPLLLIVATAVLGLALGVVLAIWRERRDDRIRIAYDHTIADVPVLATLPGRKRMSPQRIAVLDTDHELRACYRRARAAVIAGAASPSVLVVSYVGPSTPEIDPSGEVAANIGWSLTCAGFSVSVIDATLGHGHLAELLGVNASPGLSETLRADSGSEPLTQQSLGMVVLPAGLDPEGSREFYAGARMARSLAWFTEQSDYVIVAGPPAGTADGEAVAQVGDALVLVVVDKESTHLQVASVAERTSRLGVRIVGAIGLQKRDDEGRPPAQAVPKPPRGGSKVVESAATSQEAIRRPAHAGGATPADSSRGNNGR